MAFPLSDNTLKKHSERAVRDHLIGSGLRALFPPTEWLEREAETLGMSNVQLRGYLDLVVAGEDPFNAKNLMERVPDVHVRDCVAKLARYLQLGRINAFSSSL